MVIGKATHEASSSLPLLLSLPPLLWRGEGSKRRDQSGYFEREEVDFFLSILPSSSFQFIFETVLLP